MFTSFNVLLISWKNWKLPKSVKSSLWILISGKDMKISMNICVRNMCVRENIVKQCSLIPDWNSFRQECIPVGCVQPARYHTEVSMTETSRQRHPWTENPPPHLDRDPSPHLDRDPLNRDPPYRDPPRQRPLDRDPPEWESPRQRPPPHLDRDPPGQRPLRQRPPWTETPSLDRDLPDRDPLDRNPQREAPWTGPPPLLGQRPKLLPWTDRHLRKHNLRKLRLRAVNI